MIFEKNIAQVSGADGDIINNWLVFGCSVLLSIGFLFIIPRRKKAKAGSCVSHGANVSVKGNMMGSTSMYIDCDEFGRTETEKYIQNKCGAIEIHFENPCSYLGGATLHLDSKLGAIEVHVPREWRVDCDDVRLTLGVIDWDKNGVSPDGPLLIIDGDVKLGAVDVNRV